MIRGAATAAGVRGFTSRFLLSEWTNVVDAWGIDGLERYASVPRLGRRTPLGPRQRERLWSVFEPVAAALCEQGIFTRAGSVVMSLPTMRRGKVSRSTISSSTKRKIWGRRSSLFLPPSRRRLSDALFFAGDSGQRIFQHSFSWKALGIEVRGRSATLKVCYRTSRQIRSVADRLLPAALCATLTETRKNAAARSLF